MSNNPSIGRGKIAGSSTLSFPQTLLLALILEGIVLTLAGTLFAHADVTTKPDKVIELAFDEPKKPQPKREEPKHEPKIVPKKVAQPAPVPPRRVVVPPPAPVKPPPVVDDSPVSEHVVPPPPPAPPRPSNDAAQKEADFIARLRAAIQAAMVYPAAARMSGFHGKARVEFVFRDGRFSQVRLIQGSGSGMIDRAALAAVMAAICPPIPESLKGRSMTYQVALLFDLVSAD